MNRIHWWGLHAFRKFIRTYSDPYNLRTVSSSMIKQSLGWNELWNRLARCFESWNIVWICLMEGRDWEWQKKERTKPEKAGHWWHTKRVLSRLVDTLTRPRNFLECSLPWLRQVLSGDRFCFRARNLQKFMEGVKYDVWLSWSTVSGSRKSNQFECYKEHCSSDADLRLIALQTKFLLLVDKAYNAPKFQKQLWTLTPSQKKWVQNGKANSAVITKVLAARAACKISENDYGRDHDEDYEESFKDFRPSLEK